MAAHRYATKLSAEGGEVEELVSDRIRDVTDAVRREEAAAARARRAEPQQNRDSAQNEDEDGGEEEEEMTSYERLLWSFGNTLSDQVKRRREATLAAKRRQQQEALKQQEQAAAQAKALQKQKLKQQQQQQRQQQKSKKAPKKVEEKAAEEEEDGAEEGSNGEEEGRDEQAAAEGDEEAEENEAEEAEEPEETDNATVQEEDLTALGVEEEQRGDPFHSFATEIESGEEVAALLATTKWNTHDDEVLGVVRTRLPPTKESEEAQSADAVEPSSAVFPPVAGSRLPTSVSSRPATSLVTRFKMKKRLSDQWEQVFAKKKTRVFTDLQEGLFPAMNEYKDLLFTGRTGQNAAEIRSLYVLHAINHLLKTRDTILKNSAKLNATAEEKKALLDLRDQGFVRPKILILVPFRNTALEVVKLILQLAPKLQQERVANKNRFFSDYGVEEETINPNRPQDYLDTFSGNIDDCFRFGVSLTKKTIKLFAEFYNSDIIIASPLGLRMLVGAPGDKKRDYDFLSSLELVIADQADVFQMQNWDHVGLLFEHFNLKPKQAHDCDFSRIRSWALNTCGKYFRQTLVFSSVQTVELHALMNRNCHNMRGTVKVARKEPGSISRVVLKVQQVFHKLDCNDIEAVDDARFKYFTQKIYPQLKASVSKHVFIFFPSYFDYVRVRNFMKEDADDPSFCLCCEYTPGNEVARGRSFFATGRRDFMLFTERFHFFRRYKIKGAKNVVFYGLPQYGHFYPEILNGLSDVVDTSCTVLYSKFDVYQLQAIVGDERASFMLSSPKLVHMFC